LEAQRSLPGGRFRLTVAAPEGTTGTVVVPFLGNPGRTMTRDGVIVWQNGAPAAGVSAQLTAAGDGVAFDAAPSEHTYMSR